MGEFRPGPISVVHEWGSWALVRQTFTGPDDKEFDRTYVQSPGVVAVVALDGSGGDTRIVMVRQYRPAVGETLWELPAGMRDVPGETPVETAKRELAEETGYWARSWSHFGRCVQSPGTSNATVDFFMATDLVAGQSMPQGPEEQRMSVHVIALEEARRMVEGGEIVNAMAVIGILRAAGAHG